MRIKLKKTREVRNFVNVLKNEVTVILRDSMKTAAKQLEEDVKRGLYEQTFRLKPLSRAYLRWKREQGLDTRILIATGEYVSNIRAKALPGRAPRRGRPATLATWEVGVPRTRHRASGLWFHQLARIHEFGRRGLPARPHWRPAWTAFRRRDAGQLIKNVYQSARRRARLR